jgi:transposase InsO family protein
MDIKRSTLYYRAKSNKKIKEADIKDRIATISLKHPYYSYRRITAQLKREKVRINHKRVLRMMRKMGTQGKIKHQYMTTTNSKHNNKIYPNLTKDKMVTSINQLWCADITYISILNGFIYLAAIIDIYS